MTKNKTPMSAILSADDLNDFISPGVACIKPVESEKPNELNENGEVDIQLDQNGNPLQVSQIDGKHRQLTPAQISLADCLACSGCITSAEEILVAQHSHDELIKVLTAKASGESDKVFVASISHQSRASLATAFSLSVDDIDRLLVNLFINQMGFNYIVGTSLGRKLSLINESHNLITKKEAGVNGPTLSSICPGWVLYAEKTHPHVLPRLSTVKSPQQITGCILKSLAATELQVSRDKVYHLSIMPCFDKKLESARPEEIQPEMSGDVDCVLTPKELVALLEQYQQYQLMPENYKSILASPTPLSDIYRQCAPQSWPFIQHSWSNDSGSSSGGYGYNYLKMYQNHLMIQTPQQYSPEGFSIQTVGGRNPDIYELRLMYNGTSLASSAIVNGFKNIQNLVRKLKPQPQKSGRTKENPLVARRRARVAQRGEGSSTAGSEEIADASKCDYVEIMACPSGCINGGGQISHPADVSEKDWLLSVLDNYNSIPMFDLNEGLGVGAVQELVQWSQMFCNEMQVNSDRLLQTHFNEVAPPTDQGSILLGAKW